MLCQQLLASGRARRFSGGALHDPFRRLEENRPHSHSHVGHHAATDFTLDVVRLLQKLFFLYLRDDHDIFRSKIGIEHAQRNGPAVVNRGMAANNLFDVLRINVLATDNEQVLLAADDIKFAVEVEAEVPAIIPAVTHRIFGEIGTVVVALEQRVALDGDLAHVPALQHLTGIGDDLHAIAGQQLPRRREGNSTWASFMYRRDEVLGAEALSVSPDHLWAKAAIDARLRNRKHVF